MCTSWVCRFVNVPMMYIYRKPLRLLVSRVFSILFGWSCFYEIFIDSQELFLVLEFLLKQFELHLVS